MSELAEKERRAIKILRMYRGDDPIEVSYSGGKDSDVILALTKMAGIPYRAIYKNTTIDPPGTVQHCKDNGVEVVMPKERFFDLIAANGFPSRSARHCCRVLKEYKVLDNAIHGIRAAESTKRAARYREHTKAVDTTILFSEEISALETKEPIVCRNYSKKEHVNVYLPILEWSDADVANFIKAHSIQAHPLYYTNGVFNVNCRVGCIGCPQATDNGLANFRKYPKMAKQWIKAGQRFLETHPDSITARRFKDGYQYFAAHLFDSLETFEAVTFASLFGKEDWKQRLEDYFKIEL
jgi:phosphoadenosine phosphosulfate reductase